MRKCHWVVSSFVSRPESSHWKYALQLLKDGLPVLKQGTSLCWKLHAGRELLWMLQSERPGGMENCASIWISMHRKVHLMPMKLLYYIRCCRTGLSLWKMTPVWVGRGVKNEPRSRITAVKLQCSQIGSNWGYLFPARHYISAAAWTKVQYGVKKADTRTASSSVCSFAPTLQWPPNYRVKYNAHIVTSMERRTCRTCLKLFPSPRVQCRSWRCVILAATWPCQYSSNDNCYKSMLPPT